MKPFKWQCPYCNHDTTIGENNFVSNEFGLNIDNSDGHKLLRSAFIVCPNPECNRYSFSSVLYDAKYGIFDGRWQYGDLKEIKRWRLVPNSFAKVFPTYIPKSILNDYEEACAVIDLSPKASATLSRRCLQGMIRDFWKVKKGSLFLEIEEINNKVDALTWQSIDATRKIGNIGAHMEKDINLIIDVEPREASALIILIEILIKDWYINRHEREQTLKSVIGIAKDKVENKTGAK